MAKVIGRFALFEQQQLLAARAQALQIGRWAESRGARVVVLKGGAAGMVSRQPVGMTDLDVLAAPETALQLATYLDRTFGFRPVSQDSGRGHHLSRRMSLGLLPVEVHIRLKEFDSIAPVLDRAVPLVEPGLAVLAPEDHLWHLLIHGAVMHRERRGRLRELMLVSEACGQCDSTELLRIGSRIRQLPLSQPISAVLAMAHQLADGRSPDDAFAAEAAARYLLSRAVPTPRRFRRDLTNATFALLGPPGEYRQYWRGIGGYSVDQPGGGVIGLSQGLNIGWRSLRLGSASIMAIAVASAARCATRRHRR